MCVSHEADHLVVKIFGHLTAIEVCSHLAHIATHQCRFHSSKGFTHNREALQEEASNEINMQQNGDLIDVM